MEDTKLLKETAIQNAKNVLVEAISPQIKEFVDGVVEGDLDEMAVDPVMEMGAPEGDEEELDAPEEMEGMYEAKDDEELEGEEETVDEVIEVTNEDLQAALSEMIRSELSEAAVTSGFGDVDNPNKNADGGLGDSGAPGETGIADEKTGEHHWKDEEAPASEDWTVAESAYKRKIKALSEMASRLKKENKDYKQACSYLKRNLQEVNLFNSKLLYTNKLMQNTELNSKQRVSVIESFDRAESLREVELVYKSLSESLKIAGVLGEGRGRRTPKVPKSSRYVRTGGTSEVLEEQRQKESNEESFSSRMQRLSGLVD